MLRLGRTVFLLAIAVVVVCGSSFPQLELEVHRNPSIVRPIDSEKYYPIVKRAVPSNPELLRLWKYKQTVTDSVYLNGSIIELGEFFTHMTIGSQKIRVPLLIDTGSSTLTVPTVGCIGCGNATEYNPDNSHTSHGIPCSDKIICNRCTGEKCCSVQDPKLCGFHIQYGSGFVEGSLINDTVCFSDHCATATIGAIQKSKNFGPTTMGIFGMAFKELDCNPSCITPLFNEFVEQNVYANIFALCLTNDGGVLDLGYWNPARVTTPPVYVPIVLEAWYIIPMNDILVGDTSIDVPIKYYQHSDDIIGSFVDSGATLVYQHPQIFTGLQKVFQTNPLYKDLPGVNGSPNIFTQGGNASCVASIKGYPTLTFVLSGEKGQPDVHLELPPSYYMLYMPTTKCFQLGVAPNPEIGVVLGDVFIASHYVIFDRANFRLGFSPIQNCKIST